MKPLHFRVQGSAWNNCVWTLGVWVHHPCMKLVLLAGVQGVSGAAACTLARGEMTLADSVKVCLTGAASESALFFAPPLPPAAQSIQLLSPQGSRQSIKASGCILLTCAAPLMNSQHDPGWQAGNGCNKDCFCMLFASLINHLAVQQIREPHGNLISHGKGEEEGNSGGRKSWEWQGHSTLFPFFSQQSEVRCVVAEWKTFWVCGLIYPPPVPNNPRNRFAPISV